MGMLSIPRVGWGCCASQGKDKDAERSGVGWGCCASWGRMLSCLGFQQLAHVGTGPVDWGPCWLITS